MRGKYLIRGLRMTPKKFLGFFLLLNVFPLACLLIGIAQGYPLFESYLIGFAVDAAISIIFAFFYLIIELIYHD